MNKLFIVRTNMFKGYYVSAKDITEAIAKTEAFMLEEEATPCSVVGADGSLINTEDITPIITEVQAVLATFIN